LCRSIQREAVMTVLAKEEYSLPRLSPRQQDPIQYRVTL
jgi:hypothetical protein